jgi:hypothetical protein
LLVPPPTVFADGDPASMLKAGGLGWVSVKVALNSEELRLEPYI